MKKIAVLTAAVFFLGVNCFAQKESEFKSLREKIAKSDIATQDPKKGINPKTWMDRGKLFHEAYSVNMQYMHFGMNPIESKLYFKEPKQIFSFEEEGIVKETYEFNQIKLNFENDALKSWEEIQTVVDDPLGQAVEAFQKAVSLDEKGRNIKKIKEACRFINMDLENKFYNEINLFKYIDAYNTAMQRVKIGELTGVPDTTYYFFGGYAAFAQSEIDSSMWQLAVDNLEKAQALNYREIGEAGQLYDLLFTSYMSVGEPEKALKAAQAGFEKNPNNERIMYSLINYYLQHGENQNALEYLEHAVARDPENSKLLFAKGKVLEELGERDKSIMAYAEAIASEPDFFDPYYNTAVMYFNSAIKILEEINDNPRMTNAEYEIKKEAADNLFIKSIPFMEQAHRINPTDFQTMDTLKTLYYRLKSKYPDMESKYEDMIQKLGK